MKKPELLCPVGGPDTLSAAILGGADAVYFGTKEFNARMNAKNFDRSDLADAVLRCHENGVRVYVTLNTLLTDRNLPKAMDLVSFLYDGGVDALIVADVGFAHLVRQAFPDFDLHGSTQMSGHLASSARYLADMGLTRMVCAREIDRKNLRLLCQNSPIEIELFVHGAICASHSGQCLMSSMIGDRSGNRGECAQPCRLPYNGSYPLSFKDLTLANHVTEIMDMGVSSLKIEGRMKRAEYIYTVSRVWRTLLDEGRNATKKELDLLSGVFSRSGFTDGYFTGKISSNMLGIRTEKDKAVTEKTNVKFVPSGRKGEKIMVSRSKREEFSFALPEKVNSSFGHSARFLKPEQIPETNFFREIYLPLDEFDGNKANGILLPSVIFDGEREQVKEKLQKAVQAGATHALVGNFGHFDLLRDLPLTLHGDFRLNVTNSFSLSRYCDLLADSIVSPELNLAQLRDLRGKKTVIVYGRLPLMLLEKRVGCRQLRDRRGITFPVFPEGKRDVVYNSVPIYMLDRAKELKEKGLVSHHYIFTTETQGEIRKILLAAKEKAAPGYPVKRIR